MIKFIILFSFFLLVNCQEEEDDYCSISEEHIACNNNGEINEDCADTSSVIDMSNVKQYLVALHNAKRNKIASGIIDKFYPASRMATMEWDDELAQLAELNVKTCDVAVDACCNTYRFSNVGQNIERWWGNPPLEPRAAAKIAVENWFNEYINADVSIINSYRRVLPDVGHFTVIVSDKNTKLGCGMLQSNNRTIYTITCNYSTNNIIEEPVYDIGEPGSLCITGTNPDYPGLCSPDEDIDPNDYD